MVLSADQEIIFLFPAEAKQTRFMEYLELKRGIHDEVNCATIFNCVINL